MSRYVGGTQFWMGARFTCLSVPNPSAPPFPTCLGGGGRIAEWFGVSDVDQRLYLLERLEDLLSLQEDQSPGSDGPQALSSPPHPQPLPGRPGHEQPPPPLSTPPEKKDFTDRDHLRGETFNLVKGKPRKGPPKLSNS
ncbi:unnamed protein product [Gadus morhua 'NCC']